MPQLVSPLTYDGAFNAKAYGAKGDNTTNDAPAIQAALDAADAVGGGVVIIPPGNYRLNAQLNVPSDTTLVATGAYLWSGAANYLCVSNVTDATAFGGGQNIHIVGGIWDGKAQDAAAEAAYNVMGFYHCRNVSVRDAIIRNVASWHGLEFNSSDGCIADNVRFEGFLDTTAALSRQFSAAIQIDLGANDSTCSKNVTVRNCYVGPAVDGSGLDSFGRGFDSHTDALGFWYTGIEIMNNVIEDTIQEGIQTYSWNDSVVSGNVIRNAGKAGIKVAGNAANDVKNLVISNNVIDSPVENGILVGAVGTRTVKNSTISNNIVDNPSAATNAPGIYLNYTQSSTLSGNCVTGGANIGISLVNCDNSTVTANVCTNTGHDGIRVGESGMMLVSNNRIISAAQYGVYVLGNTSVNNAIISNFISDAGTGNTAAAAMGMSNTAGDGNTFMSNRCIKPLGTSGATSGFKSAAISSGSGGAIVVFNSFHGYSSTYTTAISDGRSAGTGDNTPMNDDIAAVGTANNNIGTYEAF